MANLRSASFSRLAALRSSATILTAAAATPAAEGVPAAARSRVRIRDHRIRTEVATPARRVGALRWTALDPSLIGRFGLKTPYKRREELSVPVAPAGDVNDRMIFEAAKDPAQRFYLPAYILAEESVVRSTGGALRYRFKLTTATGEKPGVLGMNLLRVSPSGLDVTGVTPIEHAIGVFLRFYRPLGASGAVEDRRTFASWTEEADGSFHAELELPRLADCGTVLMALTNPDFRPEIVVTRTITVAVPVEVQGGVQLYRPTSIAVDNPLEPRPFVFPANDPAFEGVAPSQEKPGFIRRTVRFGERHHNYYQDQLQRDVFFYLPDEIRIARSEDPPRTPMVSVRFEATDGKPDDIQAVMEIASAPVTDPERLESASKELAQFCPEQEPQFAPLQATEGVRFRLGLPGNAAFQDRPDARVDLTRGIVDRIRLPLASFQTVFDALFGSSSVLLQGEVVIDLGDGPDEAVPFTGRMDHLAGDPLESIETAIPESGGVATVLRNVTESPVEIRALRAALDRGDERVEGTIQGLDLSSPVTIAPGSEIAFTVLPTAPLGGDGPTDAVFDLADVRTHPDPTTLWNLLLDPATPATYTKSITVRALPALFLAPQDRPDEAIGALTVEFQAGETVELNAEQLTAAASLRLPIADLVLHRADEGTYRYRVRVIRNNGQTTVTDWIDETTTILFPDVRR